MIDVKLRYQAIISIDGSNLTPNAEVVTTLMKMFDNRGFLPNTFHEKVPGEPLQPRLRLSTSNGEWNLNFSWGHILIEKNLADPKGENLGSVETFCEDANDIVVKVFEQFKKKAHRLSLVTNFMLKEMSDNSFRKIFQRLFNTPPFYENTKPIEWEWRIVSGTDPEWFKERLIVNSAISRVQGEMGTPSQVLRFDRIQIFLDLSTTGENKEMRFDADGTSNFYSKIPILHKNVLTELTGFING